MAKARFIPDALDITVKSGDPCFAPTWSMVMGYKDGSLTEADYTEAYTRLMRQSLKDNPDRWLQVAQSRTVTFLCYCKAGTFCHRYILVDLMTKYAESIGIDVFYAGEYL